MRIGIAGAGRIGAFHAQTLANIDAVGSLVVADVDPERARALAERLDVDRVGAPEDLFEGQLDGLVVAATTAAHMDLILRSLALGCPVFCEKPVAVDLASTRKVLDAVAASGVQVQVGFQRRFDAGFAAVRAAVMGDGLGWLHTVRASTFDPAPPPPEYIPVSGGLFRDCAVHDFDAIRWVTGQEVVEVYASGGNQGADFIREAGDIDTGSALLTMSSGCLAQVAVTRHNGAGYDVRFEAFGSTRSASVDGGGHPATRPGTAELPFFMTRFVNAYDSELRAFIDVALGNAPSPCTVADAAAASLIAEACELSRREGRPVLVREIGP
jgi:myo-inositol 2-dehydrogenase/D-chiro-inositol 1-dehydrogenase